MAISRVTITRQCNLVARSTRGGT